MAIARTRPLTGPMPHPGEVLRDELEAGDLSAHALAIALLSGRARECRPSTPLRPFDGRTASQRTRPFRHASDQFVRS
jgi:hypothetical protein